MLRFWSQILRWHQRHRAHDQEWLELLEIFMATVTELDSKLDGIRAGVDALKLQIADLKNQPPAAASQAEIDALAAKADAIQAAISA